MEISITLKQLPTSSLRKMSHNVKNSAPIQKYCKVCHDAGKSEAEYLSHFIRETREPSSKVTCPTLLALECRYCYKNGHTVKYCPVLKDSEKKRNREETSTLCRESLKKADVKPKGKSTNNNIFACLDSDSEEKVVIKNTCTLNEEFPAIAPLPLTRSKTILPNYAAALSKPAAPNPVATKPAAYKPLVMPSIVVDSKHEVNVAPWSSSIKDVSKMRSWVDMMADSDSDSDSDSVLDGW